jgi:hypothetical protein
MNRLRSTVTDDAQIDATLVSSSIQNLVEYCIWTGVGKVRRPVDPDNENDEGSAQL